MFTKLATQSDLPALNEVKELPCGDKLICVANVNGEISAMENTCLHRGGPLGAGRNRRRQGDLPVARLGLGPEDRPSASARREDRGVSGED